MDKEKTVRDHGYIVNSKVMPHRATYFFPRQFPEKRLDESPKKILDHEKKQLVNSLDTFRVESDAPKSSFSSSTTTRSSVPATKDDVVFDRAKNSAVSDLLTGGDKFRNEQKQIAEFCDWLLEKKRNRHRSNHRLIREDEDDHNLLLPPSEKATPVKDAVDQSFDRQVSLPRLSSGSSYAGSLFASDGTVTFSSDITKDDTTSSLSRVSTVEETKRHEQMQRQEEDEEKRNEECYAEKYKESYHLQLAFTKRLSFLASLASEPVHILDTGIETWDAESVSRRLWVRYIQLLNKTTLVY